MATVFADRTQGINSSLAVKAPVYLATTANITLSGFQTLDSVTPSTDGTNLRIRVKNQTDTTANGLYLMSASPWQRCRDFDGNSDFLNGTLVYVTSGATQSGLYVTRVTDPVTVDTSTITFSKII